MHPGLISRIGIGLKIEFNIRDAVTIALDGIAAGNRHAIDEALQRLIPIGKESACRYDKEPARVPDRASDEPTVISYFRGGESPIVIRSKTGIPADINEIAAKHFV